MSVSLKTLVISILLAECVSESKGACDIGYWGAECKEKCAAGCYFGITCNVDNGVCSRCIDGFYGPHCGSRCVENCITCEQDTGLCTTCEASWYGKLCNNRCSSNCYYCDITDGSCYSCLNGYWGPNCDRNCSTVSNVSQCENACKCEYCHKANGDCYKCTDGFWGLDCSRRCSQSCLLRCGMSNGLCSVGCIPGYWGSKCQYPCRFEHCLKCNSYGYCSQCQNGSWGQHRCEHKCMNCNVCNINSGYCEKCPEGSWGLECENQCTECVTCNIYSGYCDSCQPGYWGQRCDQRCPSECTMCDIYRGYCTTVGCSLNNCITEGQVSSGGNISTISIVGIVMIAVGSILCGVCVTMVICMIRRMHMNKYQTSGSKPSHGKDGYESSHQEAKNNGGVELYDSPVYEDT